MSIIRTAFKGLAGTALAVGATLAIASPASAHPEVSIACDMGAGIIDCIMWDVGGATPPYTVRWFVNGVQQADVDNDQSFFGRCSIGKTTTVKVQAWDAHGTDWASRTTSCPRQIP